MRLTRADESAGRRLCPSDCSSSRLPRSAGNFLRSDPVRRAALASTTCQRGMLTHGAIIAREYGIPCVTGIAGAAEAIHTGDVVTVDGYLGIVTIERGGY